MLLVPSKARDQAGLNLTRPVAEPLSTGVRMEGEAPQAAVGSGEGSGSGTDGAHPTLISIRLKKIHCQWIDKRYNTTMSCNGLSCCIVHITTLYSINYPLGSNRLIKKLHLSWSRVFT